MSTDSLDPQGPMRETAASYEATLPPVRGDDVDISLLRTSLAMTPWERMLANDDALNFAESLRSAMARRNAQPL
jgi:hypothetical protein